MSFIYSSFVSHSITSNIFEALQPQDIQFTKEQSVALPSTRNTYSMAAQQKRLLTSPASKLGKAEIVVRPPSTSPKSQTNITKSIFRKEDSWALLPAEVRENLY